MKKLLTLLLALALVLSLAACTANKDAGVSDAPAGDAQTQTPQEDAQPETPADDAQPQEDAQPETPADDAQPEEDAQPEDGGETPEVAQSPLSDEMAALLDGVDDLPMVGDIILTADNFEAYAFIQPQDGVEGLASEAMIGSIAHSVVLLRLPEDADAAAVAAQVEANANPRKWICVEAEKVIVRYSGSTVLLVMSFDATADAIAANFDAIYA